VGYSIATPMKSVKAKAEMRAFMDEHYRDIKAVTGGRYNAFAHGPTDDLAYDHGKCRLGFNYNCPDPERDYIFALVKWMALRAGRRRKLEVFEQTGVMAVVPYYVYDGFEAIPIVLVSEWKGKEPPYPWPDNPNCEAWPLVDEHGWTIQGGLWERYVEVGLIEQEGIDAVVAELHRLTELWESVHAASH